MKKQMMAMVALSAAAMSASVQGGNYYQLLDKSSARTIVFNDWSNWHLNGVTQTEPPTAGSIFQVASYANGGTLAYTFSKSMFDASIGLEFKTGNTASTKYTGGSTITFDGNGNDIASPSGTLIKNSNSDAKIRALVHWWQPAATEGGSASEGDVVVFDLVGVTAEQSAYKMTNPYFSFTAASQAENYAATLNFTRGTYNFYDPEGASTANAAWLNIGNTRLNSTLNFNEGTSLRVYALGLSTSKATVNISNATLQVAHGFYMVEGSKLNVDGENAKVTIKGGSDDDSRMINGDIVINNGDFKYSSSVLFLANYNATGSITVNGGNVNLVSDLSGDGIKMGWDVKANSSLIINGGTVTSSRVRVARYNYSTSKTLIEMNGGTYTVPYLCYHQSAEHASGDHTLRLNGGTLYTRNISRSYDSSTSAQPKVMQSKLVLKVEANGGTLAPSGANGFTDSRLAVIDDVASIKLGSRGLTFENAKNAYIRCSLQSQEGQEGLFVKRGAGTVSFDATNAVDHVWTVKTMRIEEGGLHFATNATMASTDIELKSGTTLSLVGNNDSEMIDTIEVNNLKVRNATIKLDAGDKIIVNGTLDIEGLTVEWNGAAPTDATSWLVVKHEGELTLAEKLMIRSDITYNPAVADDAHIEYEFRYDSTAKETTVKVSSVDDADTPAPTPVNWIAEGESAAWATAANWQGGAKPNENKKAVFGANAAKSVTVATGDEAAGMEFTEGGYTVGGTDPLTLDGYMANTKIAANVGTTTIAAPLTLFSKTTAEVVQDAALTLEGAISGVSLSKNGLGDLEVKGQLTLDDGFTANGGIVKVEDISKLGGAGKAVTMANDMLLINNPEQTETTLEATFRIDRGSMTSNAIVRADTDVVFKDFAVATQGGNFYKFGQGKMTIEVPADELIYIGYGTQSGVTDYSTYTAANLLKLCNYDSYGRRNNSFINPCTIVEGEVYIKGQGLTSQVQAYGNTIVGAPTTNYTAWGQTAMLTVDNALYTAGYLNLGHCLSPSRTREAVIRVINGGKFSFHGGQNGYACTRYGTRAILAATNSTVVSTAASAYLTRGREGDVAGYEDLIVQYLLNNSTFETQASQLLDGSIYLDLDNGSYFGQANNKTMVLSPNTAARIYGTIYTHGGSVLAMAPWTDKVGQLRVLHFKFNDGEWLMANDGGNATLNAPVSGMLSYEVEGAGVTLKPAADKTYLFNAALTGTGGMKLDGAGTVEFAAGTLQFTGSPYLLQGTLDANGQTVSNPKFAWSSEATPVLKDCVVAGKIYVDCANAALTIGESKTIGKVDGGTLPDDLKACFVNLPSTCKRGAEISLNSNNELVVTAIPRPRCYIVFH